MKFLQLKIVQIWQKSMNFTFKTTLKECKMPKVRVLFKLMEQTSETGDRLESGHLFLLLSIK